MPRPPSERVAVPLSTVTPERSDEPPTGDLVAPLGTERPDHG